MNYTKKKAFSLVLAFVVLVCSLVPVMQAGHYVKADEIAGQYDNELPGLLIFDDEEEDPGDDQGSAENPPAAVNPTPTPPGSQGGNASGGQGNSSGSSQSGSYSTNTTSNYTSTYTYNSTTTSTSGSATGSNSSASGTARGVSVTPQPSISPRLTITVTPSPSVTVTPSVSPALTPAPSAPFDAEYSLKLLNAWLRFQQKSLSIFPLPIWIRPYADMHVLHVTAPLQAFTYLLSPGDPTEKED